MTVSSRESAATGTTHIRLKQLTSFLQRHMLLVSGICTAAGAMIMSRNNFVFTGSIHVLLFLLVCTDSAYSQVHYYIRPSLNVLCGPGDPCLTLAQFAADSTSCLSNETNISFSFLPGNHNLDRELSLSHTDNFSMTKDIEGNGTVYVVHIECGSQSGRFNISKTMFATIKGLHFIGCGGNRVNQVE